MRPANGTLTQAGRPPLSDAAKQQVTLRLDPDVLAKFREGGPGWEGRINAALRAAVEPRNGIWITAQILTIR